MNLKLLKLHLIIFFWKIIGKVKFLESELKLSFNSGNMNRVLLIFPVDEPSFRVAYYTFRELGKSSNQKRMFTFLVMEQFRDLFHITTGDKIYIQKFGKNKILNNEKQILEILFSKQYDIVIDLNPFFDLGISRLVSHLDAKIKLGFVSDFSDQFYNVQLDISRSGIMEKGFKQINWMIAK